jgi:pimeloyl-ACP methyl ester carboxylesterase
MKSRLVLAPLLALTSLWMLPAGAATVRYHTQNIDGVNVFFREAGPAEAPAVVLLHGFPTSSNMFRELIAALADRYHVIAPDYPGFGHSDMPDRTQFQYSFAHFADIADTLLTRLEVHRYALYVMDYGAPVGYRLALKHPERVTALVIQNGNAYVEGMQDFWKPIKAYWAGGQPAQRNALREGTTLAATRSQYLDGVADRSRIDPSAWVLDQALLDRPGNVEIQLDLFYDYRTNVALYPQFQQFFRERQPPALIVWGKNDAIFPAAGARAYLKDLPHAELHLLDSGHFALEDRGDEIAQLMHAFLDRTLLDRELPRS